MRLLLITATLILGVVRVGLAKDNGKAVNVERLADSIYKAEGGARTKFPYGILKKYKKTTPRQACINTIKSAQKRFAKQTKEKDFILFLSLTYCPIGAKNDPTGLNYNWLKNVRKFYERK